MSLYDDNPSYLAGFGLQYGCSDWNGRGQRYHQSIYVALLINISLNACPITNTIPFCQQACNQGLDSLTSIFTNTTSCVAKPSVQIAYNRNITLKSTSNFCKTLTPSTNCQIYNDKEASQCGFYFQSDFESYCLNNVDICCPVRPIITLMPSPSLSNTGMVVDSIDRSLFFGFVSLAAAFIGTLLILLPILMCIRKKNQKKKDQDIMALSSLNPITQPQIKQNIYTFRDLNGTYQPPVNSRMLPNSSYSETESPTSYGNNDMFKTMKVIYEYVPQLQDELRLNFGDI
ncbi:hypothetical protein HK096_006699, partial [Nowakowskiella sp. JEL0078]